MVTLWFTTRTTDLCGQLGPLAIIVLTCISKMMVTLWFMMYVLVVASFLTGLYGHQTPHYQHRDMTTGGLVAKNLLKNVEGFINTQKVTLIRVRMNSLFSEWIVRVRTKNLNSWRQRTRIVKMDLEIGRYIRAMNLIEQATMLNLTI